MSDCRSAFSKIPEEEEKDEEEDEVQREEWKEEVIGEDEE